MKINGIPPSSSIDVKASNRKEQLKEKMPSLGTDKAAVSNKAQSFQTLLLKAKELPAVREVRVSEISDQLANGQYNFDSRKLAKLLIDGPIQ